MEEYDYEGERLHSLPQYHFDPEEYDMAEKLLHDWINQLYPGWPIYLDDKSFYEIENWLSWYEGLNRVT